MDKYFRFIVIGLGAIATLLGGCEPVRPAGHPSQAPAPEPPKPAAQISAPEPKPSQAEPNEAKQVTSGEPSPQGDRKTREMLDQAKTLHCSFVTGYKARWTHGTLELKPTTSVFNFVFAELDYQRGQAKLLENQGSTPVVLISSVNGISFVEVTAGGTVNTTSVFASGDGETSKLPAVTSRHIHFSPVSPPEPEQLHGTCTIVESTGAKKGTRPASVQAAGAAIVRMAADRKKSASGARGL